jgi:hypothetical protein
MVAIHPASWLTNLIPLTQGWSQVGSVDLLRGMWDTLNSFVEETAMIEYLGFSDKRRGSDPLVRTKSQAVSSLLSTPMADHQGTASRPEAYPCEVYPKISARDLSDAAAHGGSRYGWVAGIMADRSKGSSPTLFASQNPLIKLVTQFQLEVNNQLSFSFKDLNTGGKKKRSPAPVTGVMKFLLGAWLYDELYEYLIGRRPALDPLGILNDSIGDFTGYELPNMVELGIGAVKGDLPSFQTERLGYTEATGALFKGFAEELPFVGGLLGGGRLPIYNAVPNFVKLFGAAGKLIFNQGNERKNWNTLKTEIIDPMAYLALPFGGGQVKKAYQGIQTVLRQGSYAVDSEGRDILQYPVFNDSPVKTAMNFIQSVIFGKSALPEAREWVEREFKSMSAVQTAMYQGLLDVGVSAREAYGILEDLSKVEDPDKEDEYGKAYLKLQLLKESKISKEGKGRHLLRDDGERRGKRAYRTRWRTEGADAGEVAKVLSVIKEANVLRGEEGSKAKREALRSSELSPPKRQ